MRLLIFFVESGLMWARMVHWFLGLKILPTGLGFKVGQNGPFYTTPIAYNLMHTIRLLLLKSYYIIKSFIRNLIHYQIRCLNQD